MRDMPRHTHVPLPQLLHLSKLCRLPPAATALPTSAPTSSAFVIGALVLLVLPAFSVLIEGQAPAAESSLGQPLLPPLLLLLKPGGLLHLWQVVAVTAAALDQVGGC